VATIVRGPDSVLPFVGWVTSTTTGSKVTRVTIFFLVLNSCSLIHADECRLFSMSRLSLDVAVGAPYEAENRGAVYIYIGSSRRLILSQKLSPENIHPSIRGFGYSLSGEVDIDEDSYGGEHLPAVLMTRFTPFYWNTYTLE